MKDVRIYKYITTEYILKELEKAYFDFYKKEYENSWDKERAEKHASLLDMSLIKCKIMAVKKAKEVSENHSVVFGFGYGSDLSGYYTISEPKPTVRICLSEMISDLGACTDFEKGSLLNSILNNFEQFARTYRYSELEVKCKEYDLFYMNVLNSRGYDLSDYSQDGSIIGSKKVEVLGNDSMETVITDEENTQR